MLVVIAFGDCHLASHAALQGMRSIHELPHDLLDFELKELHRYHIVAVSRVWLGARSRRQLMLATYFTKSARRTGPICNASLRGVTPFIRAASAAAKISSRVELFCAQRLHFVVSGPCGWYMTRVILAAQTDVNVSLERQGDLGIVPVRSWAALRHCAFISMGNPSVRFVISDSSLGSYRRFRMRLLG